MRVVHRAMREGKIKVRIDTLDDLWYLHGLIETGDHVYSVTFRRDEAQADMERAKRPEKHRVYMGIKVERMEFHEFSDRLRVLGTIVEGDESFSSHHTFNLTVGDELAIIKDEWRPYHLERLDEAVAASNVPNVIIVSMDDEGATIAELRAQGVRQVAFIESHATGKLFSEKQSERDDKAKEYFGQVLAKVTQLSSVAEGEPIDIVICGPGFTREGFARYLADKRSKVPMFTEGTAHAGMNGVNEVLKSGVTKVVERSKAAEQALLMDRLMVEISKDGAYAYGHQQVMAALEAGAVEILLVTEEVMRTELMDRLSVLARKCKARVTILPTADDAGGRLKGLGGVAALLRYKLG